MANLIFATLAIAAATFTGAVIIASTPPGYRIAVIVGLAALVYLRNA